MNNDFILGEEQQLAIDSIINFIKTSKEVAYSLVGYAGTGKTTIIKWLINYLEQNGIYYTLAAPTHKAKSVMKYATNREAMTIHQILQLTPNIEILDLDLRDLQFVMNKVKKTQIPYKGVLLCDESSMINDPLFNLLVSKAKGLEAKIIFIGDIAQLKPVKSLYSSLVFNTKDSFELTTVYRQSNESGLATVLPILRNNPIYNFNSAFGKDGSLICKSTPKDLFLEAIPCFREAIAKEDIFKAKMYAYTNNRSSALNNKMRSILFPGTDQYYSGEILTAYENFSYGDLDYWNSMDYIIASPPIKTEKNIPHVGIFPGFLLELYDTAEDSTGNVFILDKDTSSSTLLKLASVVESTRLAAIDLKERNDRRASLMWQKYYEIINSFTVPFDLYYDGRVIKKKTFDYGYASTVHKSQGSSIDNVFIDMKNIITCRDTMELRQLQYVSISRTRNNAYILQ